jgi:hypothetical protein
MVVHDGWLPFFYGNGETKFREKGYFWHATLLVDLRVEQGQ